MVLGDNVGAAVSCVGCWVTWVGLFVGDIVGGVVGVSVSPKRVGGLDGDCVG